MRSEQAIFSELDLLCSQSGFAHAVAYICFRDTVTNHIAGNITGADFEKMRVPQGLIRTEILALTGCMAKSEIDWEIPDEEAFITHVNDADKLLSEYKTILEKDANYHNFDKYESVNLFLQSSGKTLREIILYSMEPAQSYQYREMAFERYKHDIISLAKYHNYSPNNAKLICRAIIDIQKDKLKDFNNCWKLYNHIRELKGNKTIDARFRSANSASKIRGGFLPLFEIDILKISEKTNLVESDIVAFLQKYTLSSKPHNKKYLQIDDSNITSQKPIFLTEKGNYYLFSVFSLMEAVYESPIFWLTDKNSECKKHAENNQGKFAEDYIYSRLCKIFPEKIVHKRVNILDGQNIIGEIDCLVMCSEIALIFEVKSKGIRIKSRKGNMRSIDEDFGMAVQEAYDGTKKNAKLLLECKKNLIREDGGRVEFKDIKAIFPICLTSAHYPSLAIQTRCFLERYDDEYFKAPLVSDIFWIDTATEILPSPLQFIDYIVQRAKYSDNFIFSHENVLLGKYLAEKFGIDEQRILMDSYACNIDAIMASRRDNL